VTDLRQTIIGACSALLVSGIGWTVHAVVVGTKSEAVIAEKLAAHDRAINRHEATLEKIDRIETLVDRTTENVARLLDAVKTLDERQDKDARELRARRK
jgi:hypothetical protein